jgi:hypothetical protein
LRVVGCELGVVGCGDRRKAHGANRRVRKSECGLRPIGACTYAPVGMRKKRLRILDLRGRKAEKIRI